MNKNAERLKTRLTDECTDYKKKLRDQIRTNKEIDEKYVRYKDMLQRTKSTMNKISDEISEQLKRGMMRSESITLVTPTATANGDKTTEKQEEASKAEMGNCYF